jgi:hypothetical protein
MAVLKNVSVTQYFEEALRAKLDNDYQGGRYEVGKGGMYIPPPSPKLSKSIDEGVDSYKSGEAGRIDIMDIIAKCRKLKYSEEKINEELKKHGYDNVTSTRYYKPSFEANTRPIKSKGTKTAATIKQK